jgi:uncharacterized membrane protein
MKKTTTLICQSLFALTPLVYLFSIWKDLPEQVPMHYNMNNEVDDYGSRPELAGAMLILFALSVGLSLLMLNIEKIDPKKRFSGTSPLMYKISWACTLFMTFVAAYIVYDTDYFTLHQKSMPVKYVMAGVALLFAVLGNFMNSIKPNYFVGLRTPWSLEDEDNWKKTHQVGSKIWFFGGLLMFVLIMVLPNKLTDYVMIFSLVPMVIVPLWYSYYLYRQKQKQLKH